jgi:hypothetical protein
MYTSQRITCVNGPWWFVQMWLQLHMHQIVGVDLNSRFFPLSNHPEGEPQATRGCQNYGEAASTVLIQQDISQLFELFFKGFSNPLWLPYLGNDTLTFPVEFSFEPGHQDRSFLEIFNIIIRPCILPAEFNGGRQNVSTYEYYQPQQISTKIPLMTQQISTKIPHDDFFICRAPSSGKKLYKQLLQKVALFHVLKLKSKQICII